jgi:hypothetical protein
MNCHTWLSKNFGQFLSKGGTLTEKKHENFFSTKYDNNMGDIKIRQE